MTHGVLVTEIQTRVTTTLIFTRVVVWFFLGLPRIGFLCMFMFVWALSFCTFVK